LISRKMLAYDGEDMERPSDLDLVKLTPSGFIHLRSLPHFIEYLSSVCLHCPVRDSWIAERIADVWKGCERYPDLDFTRKHSVAELFSDYLVREKARLDSFNPLFRERCREAETIVKAVTQTINASAAVVKRIRSRQEMKIDARKRGN